MQVSGSSPEYQLCQYVWIGGQRACFHAILFRDSMTLIPRGFYRLVIGGYFILREWSKASGYTL